MTFDFNAEATRVCDAIGSRNGHGTVVAALREAFAASLPPPAAPGGAPVAWGVVDRDGKYAHASHLKADADSFLPAVTAIAPHGKPYSIVPLGHLSPPVGAAKPGAQWATANRLLTESRDALRALLNDLDDEQAWSIEATAGKFRALVKNLNAFMDRAEAT